MKEVRIALTVALLCIGKISYTQTTVFNKVYNYNNFHDAAFDVIETYDGNFLFVGGSSLGGDNRTLIVKLDNNGDTLWSKKYDLSIGGDNAHNVIELTNGNFLLCGSLHDTATVTAKGYLMLVNAQGDSLWIQQYASGSGANADLARNLVLAPDGGFVVSGWSWLAPSLTTSDAWVFKTDSLGNLLWEKQFDGYGLEDKFDKVIITPDGNIICAGVTVINAVTGLDYVVKLNQQGDTIWTREFGGIGGGGIFDLNNTQDGGFIGCGATEGAIGDQRASVYKLDSLGNLLWYNTYARGSGVGEYYSFSAIHELPNGNFMAAGVDFDYTQVPSKPRERLMMFDALGDSLWSKQYTHYGDSSEDYLLNMKPTSDGGFIFCGYIINSGSPLRNDAWIVKVDSNGCDNIPCQLSVGLSEEEELRIMNKELKVYPNPANDWLTISIDNYLSNSIVIEVFDLMGKQMLSEIKTPSNNKIKMNTSTFSNGIYLFRLIFQDGTTDVFKVSVNR